MLVWLGQRILSSIILVFLLLTAVFFIVRLAPGNPMDLMVGEDIQKSDRLALEHQLGLDRPLAVQYFSWLGNLIQGDAGISVARHEPVADVIAETLPITLMLTLTAYLLHLVLAISSAVLMSSNRTPVFGSMIQAVGLFFYSVPPFWLGLMLIMVFAGILGWFPTHGMHSADASFLGPIAQAWDLLHHMILPVTALALSMFMGTARYLRTGLAEVLDQDYILAARSRGVGHWRIMFRHALPNALLPLVTLVGLHLPFLLGGALVIEVVFGWPGMGRVTVEAIGARDYPLIMTTTLVASVAVVVGSLLADILYTLVDPRVRQGSREGG
ncbi:MAG: ABC transporter permease [bacterium]|nr:ABC transporter permease [bacterium]